MSQGDYIDREDLECFAKALNESGYWGSDARQAVDDVLYLFEKPWKYEEEFEEWKSLGRPDTYNPMYGKDFYERMREEDKLFGGSSFGDEQILSFFKR